jgi:(E)-4-hydroxy-3-methylbut-2-enyl-diphosphate synthase
MLAEAIDCPLHLGVTEAGPLRAGTIKSAIGLGSMLWAGSATPSGCRWPPTRREIKVGFDILKSLGLRHRGVNIIACPSCARQGFNVIETTGRPRGAAGAHRYAHEPQHHRLRGERPGEALYTDVASPAAQGAGHGLHGRQGRTISSATATWSSTSWASSNSAPARLKRRRPQRA